MVKLAKEFDISDVGLAKVCRAHNIPLPPRGHWAKLQHGKASPTPKLPPSKETTVTFDAQRHRIEALRGKRSNPADSPRKVEVQATGAGMTLSPFTKATQKKLLATKRSDGLIGTYDAETFECRVSHGSIDTLSQLLDAIERAVPTFGGALKPGEKALDFVFEEQAVSFRITEQYTTRTVEVPKKKYDYWQRPEVVYDFTGKFTLEIQGYFEGRKKWADGKRQKLTEVLTDFMEGLVAAAKSIKRIRLEREEQHRRWQEESERRAELERRQRDLQDFRTKLIAEAKAAQDHVLLVEYVDRVRSEIQNIVGPLPEPTVQWLSTASALAGSEAPLVLRTRRLAKGVVRDYGTGSFGRPVA
jgi:hypothetical protein